MGELFIYLLLFLVGASIGSFLNVLIYRFSKRENLKQILSGRSYCPNCKTPLRWYDNIPFCLLSCWKVNAVIARLLSLYVISLLSLLVGYRFWFYTTFSTLWVGLPSWVCIFLFAFWWFYPLSIGRPLRFPIFLPLVERL